MGQPSPFTIAALNSIIKKPWRDVLQTEEQGRAILAALEAATKSNPRDIKGTAEAMYEELLDEATPRPKKPQEGQQGAGKGKGKDKSPEAPQSPVQSADDPVAQSNDGEDGEDEGESETPEGGEGEEEGDEDEDDHEDQQNGEANTQERFDLEEFIVKTAKRRRDEILDGIDFGGIGHDGFGTSITFSAPNLPSRTVARAHNTLPLLVKSATLRRPIMLVGPAGSGKTTAGKQLAEINDVPFYANSNSEADTRYLAFGGVNAGGTYNPGYLYEPMKYGGVLLDDELDAGNPSVMVSKNTAIENRFAQFPNGEMVHAHPNFIYVGSANTYGRGADRIYVGRTPIDGASLNRFIFIDWDYDEDLENEISVNPKWTAWVQKVRKVVFDHKMRYVVSPRQSIAGGELLALGIPERTVRQMTVFPGWAPADVERVMREVM